MPVTGGLFWRLIENESHKQSGVVRAQAAGANHVWLLFVIGVV